MASKKDPNVEAVKNFQGGYTIDDPQLGAEDNVIPSPWSEQTLAARIADGEGDAVREELAEAAKGLEGANAKNKDG
jgi:hypothetical protein